MPPREPKFRETYRPDIDGLRCLAVLLVVVYHAFPQVLPGGFLGVDVFFVISGYLITLILINQGQGGLTLKEFYARRVIRIFPALALVLGAVLAVGSVVLMDSEYKDLGIKTLASVLFSKNLLLLFDTSYFSTDANQNPILHLWSLGVEEQFYILFPIMVLVLGAPKWRFTALVFLVLTASFVLNLALRIDHPVVNFFSPATRAWELLIGVGLALVTSHANASSGIMGLKLHPPGYCGLQRYMIDALSITGLIGIVVASILVTSDRALPGVWALEHFSS